MFDCIIIGGGPAGLCAALYGARAGLDVVVMEKLFTGGQAATTYEVDNYLGFDEGIEGPDLTMKMENHVRRAGAKIFYENVLDLDLSSSVKKVKTDKATHEAKTVILATGASPRLLGLENEDRLRGMGVSYCATCDGAFFKGKVVAVCGGGDVACEDALFLARTSEKVYLIHRRDQFRAVKSLQDKVKAEPKIEILYDSVVTRLISGIDVLEEIEVKNVKTGAVSPLKVSGLFVAIGTQPNNELLKGKLALSSEGYLLTDEAMQTNVLGVYGAGDIRKKPLRQIITAAADGALAAYQASRYIGES